MAGEFEQVVTLLKQAYPKKNIQLLANEETPFRRALKTQIPSGSRITKGLLKFGVALRRPNNVAQTKDGGNLVQPLDRAQELLTLKPTLFNGGFQIGWVTRAVATDSAVAFNGSELERRTEETISDLAKFIEQTYVGTNGSGSRGEVATGGGGTSGSATITFTLSQAAGTAGPWPGTGAGTDPRGVRLLDVYHRISVRNPSGAADLSSRRDATLDYLLITARDEAANTITCSTELISGVNTAAVAVAGDQIVIVPAQGIGITTAVPMSSAHSVAGATTGISANGLRGLIDDGVETTHLHGVARSGNSWLNAKVVANGGIVRNLSEGILISALHDARLSTGKRLTDVWTNVGQVEKYIDYIAPDKSYIVPSKGPMPMPTGYGEDSLVHYYPGGALRFNVSPDIAPREMYIISWDTIFHYLAQDMDWWDAPMLKPTPSTNNSYMASYLAHMASIENIGVDTPRANVVIRDLRDRLAGDV